MRQLSHPWQHVEGSAGAPRGTGWHCSWHSLPGTACSRGKDSPQGHQDALQAQAGGCQSAPSSNQDQ